MKLIIAIIRDTDSEPVMQALTSEKFRVTRIASTGGLLKRGVATFLVGVEDDRVDVAIQWIREKCAPAVEGEKRATIFVVPVEHFVQV
jgi:uncharacterized protein YaaQ